MTQARPLRHKAPTHLSRAEKAAFKVVSQHLQPANGTLSPVIADLLADYVQARSRVADMTKARDQLVRSNPTLTIDKARIQQLGREINSTTALSLKLADKLGLIPERT